MFILQKQVFISSFFSQVVQKNSVAAFFIFLTQEIIFLALFDRTSFPVSERACLRRDYQPASICRVSLEIITSLILKPFAEISRIRPVYI